MTIILKGRELFYSEKSQMQEEAYLAAVMGALVELAASAETY
jgi:hypothetical protein